jgi:hypothetical protein
VFSHPARDVVGVEQGLFGAVTLYGLCSVRFTMGMTGQKTLVRHR